MNLPPLKHSPLTRQGPRPLPLHLLIQTTTLLSSLAVLPNLRNGSLSLKSLGAEKQPQALLNALQSLNPEQTGRFLRAIRAEIVHRHALFLAGVTRYRRHRFHRVQPDYPVLWSQGTTKVLDCRLSQSDQPVALIVPSLINRSYILDLRPRTSLVRGLARRGIAPFLIDWDEPGPEEAEFDLTDYIVRRLEPALQAAHQATGRSVTLVGYCMGGLLAVAQALRRPDLVNGLVLLATPWDFHQGFELQRALLEPMRQDLRPIIEGQGHLSVDVLQALFASFDPDLTIRKFTQFAKLPKKNPPSKDSGAKDFILLEDWANDGVPLVKKTAIQCLEEWCLSNAPAKGTWLVDGQAVRPERLACPSLVVIPERDRIVTPASALALCHCLPNSSNLKIDGGHVGMLLTKRVGSRLHAPMAGAIKNWASRDARKS